MINFDREKLNQTSGGVAYFAMLILFVLLSLVGQALISLAFETGSIWFYLFNGLLSIISLSAVCALFVLGKKDRAVQIFYIKKTNYKIYLLVLPLFLGMFFGLGFVNGLIGELVVSLGGNIAQTELPLDNVWSYISLCVVYAVLPAVAEEFFFRGLLLNCLEKTSKIMAILSVSLCFALYHLSVIQFAYQFIYGVILCLIVIKGGSIFPAIIMHFLNNFLVLTIEYFNLPIDLYSAGSIIKGLVALALGLTLLILYNGKNKQTADEKQEKAESARGFWLPFALIGCLFCVFISVLGVIGV